MAALQGKLLKIKKKNCFKNAGGVSELSRASVRQFGGGDWILSQFLALPLHAVLIKVNFVNQKWLQM